MNGRIIAGGLVFMFIIAPLVWFVCVVVLSSSFGVFGTVAGLVGGWIPAVVVAFIGFIAIIAGLIADPIGTVKVQYEDATKPKPRPKAKPTPKVHITGSCPCPSCDTPVSYYAKFCSNCGAELDWQ